MERISARRARARSRTRQRATKENKQARKKNNMLKIIMHKLLHISHEFITHKKIKKVPKNR